MIRPFTCICMVLAGASGLYLYQEKHRAQMLDRQIASTVHAAGAARERSGVLRAEWTLLNDPERLAQLSDRFLALKTVTPGQFTTMAELDKRLPPVRQLDSKPTDSDEGEPVAGIAEPERTKPVDAPIAEAAPAPRAEPPPKSEPPPRIAVASRPPPVKVATAVPAPRPIERRPLPGPLFVSPPPRVTAVAETRSVIAAPRPVAGSAAYTPAAPFVASPSAATSVLGITRTNIAPPVPFLPAVVNTGGG